GMPNRISPMALRALKLSVMDAISALALMVSPEPNQMELSRLGQHPHSATFLEAAGSLEQRKPLLDDGVHEVERLGVLERLVSVADDCQGGAGVAADVGHLVGDGLHDAVPVRGVDGLLFDGSIQPGQSDGVGVGLGLADDDAELTPGGGAGDEEVRPAV